MKSFLLFSDISENSGQNSLFSDISVIYVTSIIYFFAKYIHSKNAFKTILGHSEAEINHFLCFDHFLSFWPYDGLRVYDGRRVYDGFFVVLTVSFGNNKNND